MHHNETTTTTSKRDGLWTQLDRIGLWATRRQRFNIMAFSGVSAVLLSGIVAFLSNQFSNRDFNVVLTVLLLLVVLLILVFSTFLFLEIIRILRGKNTAGPTQRRLVTIFVMMALVPTIIVATFSTVSMNLGFENWFSNRVKNVVDSSYDAALAYQSEHEDSLKRDGQAVYGGLMVLSQRAPNFIGNLRENLNLVATPISDIEHAFIISGAAVLSSQPDAEPLISRGSRSYLFDYTAPTRTEMERAVAGEVVLIEDWDNNEFRYLRSLDFGADYYLYLTRKVDGNILSLLDQTEQTAQFYRDSETSRQRIFIFYTLVFVGVAVIILMLAIWAALYFARRLTHPIGQLVRAVERVGGGDLDVRVPVMQDNDEFSVLSHNFNKMTEDIKSSRDELVIANAQSTTERNKFNNVLESVSSGVIGVDDRGLIDFINSSARRILHLDTVSPQSKLTEIVPEFEELYAQVASDTPNVQGQVNLIRDNNQESLFLRISRRGEGAKEGVIASFDDVSDLVQAQRMAAWGDVARRIAHEIKNPLTPIRLSAERMQRRFGKNMGDDAPKFKELTDVIVRQTEDLRRIVDEFSKFSRMPAPIKTAGDWGTELRAAVSLQSENDRETHIDLDIPKELPGVFDKTLIGQGFGNLFKNAYESIAAQKTKDKATKGQIDINVVVEGNRLQVEITDNGIGLPADKAKLFEPYMTLKETGTGLGLPIVKKIFEDHDGKLSIKDRNGGERGATVVVTLPMMILNENDDQRDN